jgi:hypothetical protein
MCNECTHYMALPAALGYGRDEVRCCTGCKEGRLNLLHVAKQGDDAAAECLLRWYR